MSVDDTLSNNVDELTLLRLDPDEKMKPGEQDYKVLNSTLISPKTKNEIPTKVYNDSLLDENEKNRRHLGLRFMMNQMI